MHPDTSYLRNNQLVLDDSLELGDMRNKIITHVSPLVIFFHNPPCFNQFNYRVWRHIYKASIILPLWC